MNQPGFEYYTRSFRKKRQIKSHKILPFRGNNQEILKKNEAKNEAPAGKNYPYQFVDSPPNRVLAGKLTTIPG